MNYVVSSWESDSPQGLDDMINAFLKMHKDIEVVNISLATCWNAKENYILYTRTILYRYK